MREQRVMARLYAPGTCPVHGQTTFMLGGCLTCAFPDRGRDSDAPRELHSWDAEADDERESS